MSSRLRTQGQKRASLRHRYPLDRVAWGLMGLLALAAGLLVLLGDHAKAQVQTFSWQDRTIGAENQAFLLNFSRPMNPDSVAANLDIAPPLPGKVSWAGRRMAYTLDAPAPYGESFQITLETARDRFTEASEPVRFEPFQGTFRSRDRAFAYIGTHGEEAGRLVLVNLSADETTVLTPPDLEVLDFEPYPLGDRLLFSAMPAQANSQEMLTADLYAVATGLSPEPPEDPLGEAPTPALKAAEAGTLTPLLSGDEYQNLAFDLSPDGRTIVVQRVNKTDPADFGPWILQGETLRPLGTEPGGEFLIAPDGETLLLLQGQGTAVIPLSPEEEAAAQEPLDFLPEYGRVFDLTSDGTAAAMVNFNQNDPEQRFTESLVLVDNQGNETELLNVNGSVIDAQIDPTDRIVYVLHSEVLGGDTYQEQPVISAIPLADPEPLDLLMLPPQSQANMSISPDGLALLFSAVATSAIETPGRPQAQVWLLPLFDTADNRLDGMPAQLSPENLPFTGLKPTWLP